MTDNARYPSLDGKVVFITGGATGIGAADVRLFAEQGARVAFVDIQTEAGEELCNAVEKSTGARPWFAALDVTDIEALQGAIRRVRGELGGFDILVNNVANDTRHSPLDATPESWRACLAVNLDAAFFAAQEAIRIFRADGNGGVIINVSSIVAVLGPDNMPGYVAAKSALVGLTKSLAREYGVDGVRVNAILPGWVATQRQLDLWLTPEAEADWETQIALKGRIAPEEPAKLALFLASADAAKITGQSFTVDAGRT